MSASTDSAGCCGSFRLAPVVGLERQTGDR
jgi:hypothetical protein